MRRRHPDFRSRSRHFALRQGLRHGTGRSRRGGRPLKTRHLARYLALHIAHFTTLLPFRWLERRLGAIFATHFGSAHLTAVRHHVRLTAATLDFRTRLRGAPEALIRLRWPRFRSRHFPTLHRGAGHRFSRTLWCHHRCLRRCRALPLRHRRFPLRRAAVLFPTHLRYRLTACIRLVAPPFHRRRTLAAFHWLSENRTLAIARHTLHPRHVAVASVRPPTIKFAALRLTLVRTLSSHCRG